MKALLISTFVVLSAGAALACTSDNPEYMNCYHLYQLGWDSMDWMNQTQYLLVCKIQYGFA